MNYRKINSHIILMLIAIIFSFSIAVVGRFIMLEKGFDTVTANLTFIVVLSVFITIYLIILSTLAHTIVPWIMKKLPERKKDIPETVLEDIPNEKEEKSKLSIENIKQVSEKQYIDKLNAKIDIFLEYTHLTMAAYITDEELLHLDEYIRSYAREEKLSKNVVTIKPTKLKNPDMFHFGWNMAHYFGYKKQDVVPWLQQVFKNLKELEESYIKGKLSDYQKEKYIIPNIDNIPAYLEKLNN